MRVICLGMSLMYSEGVLFVSLSFPVITKINVPNYCKAGLSQQCMMPMMTAGQMMVASPQRCLWFYIILLRRSTLEGCFSARRLVITLLLYYDCESACYSCLGLPLLCIFMR